MKSSGRAEAKRELYREYKRVTEALDRKLREIGYPKKTADDFDYYEETPEGKAWQSLDFSFSACIICRFWKSSDRETGDCRGPEIQCGQTKWNNGCEQWGIS